jgi:tryptophanyl-tRNA synthetase
VVEFVTPFREKTLAYLDDPAELDAILAAGAERARAVTEPTLRRVYDRLGFVPAAGSLSGPVTESGR